MAVVDLLVIGLGIMHPLGLGYVPPLLPYSISTYLVFLCLEMTSVDSMRILLHNYVPGGFSWEYSIHLPDHTTLLVPNHRNHIHLGIMYSKHPRRVLNSGIP